MTQTELHDLGVFGILAELADQGRLIILRDGLVIIL